MVGLFMVVVVFVFNTIVVIWPRCGSLVYLLVLNTLMCLMLLKHRLVFYGTEKSISQASVYREMV